MEGQIKETLHAIKSSTVRDLVEAANNIGVRKDNIISILQEKSGSYVLIYYQ